MSGLVVVFAKPPVPGRVKTRLAADVGDGVAARLARAFLSDTVLGLRALRGWDVRLSTPNPDADHGVQVNAWQQGGGDLGARMERAFRRGFDEGYDRVLAMGADSPGAPSERWIGAARSLDSHASVIGPASDGGFDLLGLRACPAGLFQGLPWSHPTTGARVEDRLRTMGQAPHVLPPWFDVDHLKDLKRLRMEVPRQRLPQTWPILVEVLGAPGSD